MEKALIIGASGGIGSAVHGALARQGVDVTGLSRRGHGLQITDEASVERCLATLDATYDLIFVRMRLPGARSWTNETTNSTITQATTTLLRAEGCSSSWLPFARTGF